jgi:hypothetical protein
MLTLYIQKEIGLQETERITEDLIANRRKILEKSQKFVLVPDESHLSVGSDTELSVDPAVYVSTAETSEKKNSKDGI